MINFFSKTKDILGMNARNLLYISKYNKRSGIKIADNKLMTKKRLKKAGLPASRLLAVIKNREELYNFDWEKLPNSFVLKPNRGLGGDGILITFGRKKNGAWVMPGNKEATIDTFFQHTSNILDGNFSITGSSDTAFIEERLKINQTFKLYAYKGIPDIRVVVFNRVPVMAMLRLPTKQSEGKANLHQGGIGIGIDISTGKTTFAVLKNKQVHKLPGTNLSLSGIKIPFWDKILEYSVEASIAIGLGYCGVDIAIDKEIGPAILEVNARPGLAIQLANQSGLSERLNRVAGLKIVTVKKGVKVAKEIFGQEIEEEIEEVSGKKVIGPVEKVTLYDKTGSPILLEAKIDTGAGVSSIDEDLAKKLGFEDAVNLFNSYNVKDFLSDDEVIRIEKRKVWKELRKHPDISGIYKVKSSHGVSFRIEVPIKISLSGLDLKTNATVIKRESLKYSMIVGRRDLSSFIVDPSKGV